MVMFDAKEENFLVLYFGCHAMDLSFSSVIYGIADIFPIYNDDLLAGVVGLLYGSMR